MKLYLISFADLSRHTVKESGEALHLLQSGQQRRTSAATASNRNSSRSHALFTVYCTAAHVDDDFPRETIAKLHLVDLAGRYDILQKILTIMHN